MMTDIARKVNVLQSPMRRGVPAIELDLFKTKASHAGEQQVRWH